MPSLTEDDRKTLLGVQKEPCPKCGQKIYKNYCRKCDEFFYRCGCPVEPNEPDSFYHNNHSGHRTY